MMMTRVAHITTLFVVLLLTYTTAQDETNKRYAIFNFVDESNYYLWGLYSMRTQLKKFNMTHIPHIAMVSEKISSSSLALIQEWLGKDGIRKFNRKHILKKVSKRNLRQGVFLKLQAFNMTEFDKIIVLDNDILLRRNIEHWFNYPAPAATGARGLVEFNSGAMVIEPSTELYNALLEHLPKTRRWTGKPQEQDPWNSNGGQQGYLSSFFLSNVTSHSIFTMNYGHSILSSDLEDRPHNEYYWKYRPHVFESVHFTRHKPWKPTIFSKSPITCSLLQEWAESVKDAPRDKLPKLPNAMKNCPSEYNEGNDTVFAAAE